MPATGFLCRAFGIRSYWKCLRELGIKVDSSVSEGTGHEFLTWRRGLHEFIPHLFKK